jgi:hypothetical protein
MNSTKLKLKRLGKYFDYNKKDQLIKTTVDKLVAMKIDQLDKEIIELKKDLKNFEVRYSLNSEEFYSKFQRGELDDNLDFVDWIAVYKMLQNRIEDKLLLRGN